MQDLKEITKIKLQNPCGWIIVPLSAKKSDGTYSENIYTLNFQIAILQMFHNGKDTHARLVKIFANKSDQMDYNQINLTNQNTQIFQKNLR